MIHDADYADLRKSYQSALVCVYRYSLRSVNFLENNLPAGLIVSSSTGCSGNNTDLLICHNSTSGFLIETVTVMF